MDKKSILIIFLFCCLKSIYSVKSNQIDYKLNIIDDNLDSSKFIIPIINNAQNILYILTGENNDIDNYQLRSTDFKKYILEFSLNSGVLLNKYSYYNSYPFQYTEAIFGGNNLQYLLYTTYYSIEYFDKNSNQAISNTFYGQRRTFKKADEYYYYADLELENKNNLIIKQYKMTDNISTFLELIKTSSPMNVLPFQEMISCDFTEDNSYILCAYFSEDKKFMISIYNNNLDFIQTIGKEISQNFQFDYFIKILYFKDNSRFVTMNSENEYITRLRYFKYINGKYISELYTIIDDDVQYIDIDETQLTGYAHDIDIIAVDSDKIIKIFSYQDKMIISIFQFYEHDNILFVKIYNMKDFINYGYNNFINPRLEIFRDAMLICLSTSDKENMQRTGYLFVNYPNSLDTKLTIDDNIIKIKELISIENNIFSLNLKCKILNIPKDFIFINSIDSKEIEEDDVLELSNELILRQYRVNEGMYILTYEGIALGRDLGYSSSKIYPSHRNPPSSDEIYIEGRHGSIGINFEDCLQGYYHLDYDLNLCTNVMPEGYYLDEKERTYKKCQSPCKTCSGPINNSEDMNCLTCIQGYNITEDTNSCYNFLPPNYYLDNDIFRRCYERCLRCETGSNDPSNMNCLECISSEYFYKKDTHNCIKPSEFAQREKKELERKTSGTFYLFIAILIAAIITSFILCFHCCCSEKYQNLNHDEIEEEDNTLFDNNNINKIQTQMEMRETQ